jgi:hypothetical protein
MTVAAGIVLSVSMVPAAPATAVSGVPITCGMVVDHAATVYLTKDLRCTGFGVVATGNQDAEDYSPHIVVDLRGHTLFGPGSGSPSIYGITAFGHTIFSPTIEVKNGRIEGWDIGVGGDSITSVKNVVLARNRVGFFCNGSCSAERSVFTRNTDYGFGAGGEATATVTASLFTHNKVGAVVGSIPFSLKISKITFLANEIGVAGYSGATLSVSHSAVIRNRTGVLYQGIDDGQCVNLTRDIFHRNGVNVNGLAC